MIVAVGSTPLVPRCFVAAGPGALAEVVRLADALVGTRLAARFPRTGGALAADVDGADGRAFRAEVIARCGGVCVGPQYGLPGDCRPVGARRDLEVHEPDQRSTHPGSHLRSELAVSLCPWHHDFCTSPSGERRELVEAAGLIVRSTS